jgi:hypothetical protein
VAPPKAFSTSRVLSAEIEESLNSYHLSLSNDLPAEAKNHQKGLQRLEYGHMRP